MQGREERCKKKESNNQGTKNIRANQIEALQKIIKNDNNSINTFLVEAGVSESTSISLCFVNGFSPGVSKGESKASPNSIVSYWTGLSAV